MGRQFHLQSYHVVWIIGIPRGQLLKTWVPLLTKLKTPTVQIFPLYRIKRHHDINLNKSGDENSNLNLNNNVIEICRLLVNKILQRKL